MKALVTGASSGIGRDMAIYLDSLGIDLILVARRKEKLEEVKSKLKGNVVIETFDLMNIESVNKLYEKYKDDDIDILINNAGFGLFGDFLETDLDRELEMISLNVIAFHVLTKKFLEKFRRHDAGYILNVCSSAGFLPGPHLATYYATKNYDLKLTMAIYEELRKTKSNIHISALCPGPVETEFNKVAKGVFNTKGVSSEYVASYAIDKMFQGKLLIIPTLKMKIFIFLSRFVPYKLLLRMVHSFQNN